MVLINKNSMFKIISVFARLHIYSGERMLQRPIYSNYRPLFDFTTAKTKLSGRIILKGPENLPPGSTALVEICFVKGIISDEFFKPGQKFKISEGMGYDLGEGEIM